MEEYPYMEKIKRHYPILLFIVAFLGYALVEITLYENYQILLNSAFVIAMVVAIVLSFKKRDEVQQSIINKAYRTGFWLTFLILYVDTIYEPLGACLETVTPMWTIPIIGWLLGYMITLIMYR